MTVHPPSPKPAVAERCAQLGDLLPQHLESLRPRVISPRSPLVHAWGSPAIVLTCGVNPPAGFSTTSAQTTVVDGVQWFESPGAAGVTWTALRSGAAGSLPVYLALQIPAHYKSPGAFLVDLAQPLKSGLT